jgi:E3 ubiquitin-protein ligase TRIP12
LTFFLSEKIPGTQRTALNTAANICRSVPPTSYDSIADAIPILTNITTYSDSKLVEKAIVCFTRLSDSFYGSDKVEKLAQHGLLQNLVHLISIPPGGTGIR